MRPVGSDEFLRAVHYFGHAHPGNFWDALDPRPVTEHLRIIRSDGFDTVILVVPWRDFQPGLRPPRMQPERLQQLDWMLTQIDAAGLGCILRVSFPWSADPDSELDYDQRGLGLFSCAQIRQAWLAYLRELRCITEAHRCFRFAFYSWEDLPAIREAMPHRSASERLQLAESTGFRQYLLSQVSLESLSELFDRPIETAEQIAVPLPDCRAYEHYNRFVNVVLGQLLADGRTAWPALSMQIRADYERLSIDGELEWLRNDLRTDDHELRVSYYFPYMFAQNGGETQSAEQALANMAQVMTAVSDQGRNSHHFLDQLVYWDESPQFAHWARIDESELGAFLVGAVDLLRPLSRGYGLWNHFDYRVNHFYNPAFRRGLHGWSCEGEVRLEVGPSGEPCVALTAGASISQSMIPDWRGNATWLYEQMRFKALCRSVGRTRLQLSVDGHCEAELSLQGDTQPLTVLPPDRHRGHQPVVVTLRNLGPGTLRLADLYLWGFVYRSRIYDEHGRPDRFHGLIRAMNAR